MRSFHKSIYTVAIAISTLFWGCSGKERVIDTLPDLWLLLNVTTDNPASLTLQKYPDNSTISNDKFQQANGRTLPSAVKSVAEFRDRLYLMMPSIKTIYIIDSKSFALKDSLVFAAVNRIPTAICFANATTAYVCHENDTVVSVVDILSFKTARVVACGKQATGIAVVGNQVFVANQLSNTVTQIDTRTNLVVAQHQVPPAPTFVQPSTDGHSAVVICLGDGKINKSVPATSSYAIFIDAPTAKITIQTALHDTYYPEDIAAVPRGMAITKSDWAFIPTDMGLFQLDLINKTSPNIIDETAYNLAFYNYRRLQLILIKDMQLIVADQNTGKKKEQYQLPFSVSAVIGTDFQL